MKRASFYSAAFSIAVLIVIAGTILTIAQSTITASITHDFDGIVEGRVRARVVLSCRGYGQPGLAIEVLSHPKV